MRTRARCSRQRGGADGSYSFFFRSVATDGHTLEMIYHSPTSNINLATLKTIYPLNF